MQTTERRRQFFKSFEAKSLKRRSLLTQVADDLTSIFGSPTFLVINTIFFIFWVGTNIGWNPWMAPFDPFPFGLLTMIVSLEAIFLSVFILVSQNRASVVSTVREEVHLRVGLIAEEEITKALEILSEIRNEMGIKRKDVRLTEMLERTDTAYLERLIAEQMSKASKSLGEQLRTEFPEMLFYPIKKPIQIVQNIASSDSDKIGKKS